MLNLETFLLQGTERQETLAAIDEQMKQWDLELPEVTALPLHFGLKNFKEIGETEFWIANEEDRGYCGKFLFVFDNQTCPYHSHRIKHETFFVAKGSVRMNVDGSERIMKQGDVLAMPPGAGHSFTGIGAALILEISMPSIRQDSFFTDKRIGEDGVL